MSAALNPLSPDPRYPGKSRAHRFATALVGKAGAVFHRLRHPATIACAYVFIGIATFGHVAAMPGRVCWDTWTLKEVPCGSRAYVKAALPAAIAWPLYWSWELQQ